MGTDKGLIVQDGKTWAQHAVDRLSSFAGEVFLSVNTDQFRIYEVHFTTNRLISDNDSLQMGGPLKGVLSAHLRYPLENWLVLACDMTAINAPLLQTLADTFQSSGYDAYVFRNEEGVQPLCGIYTSAAFELVYSYYLQGKLIRFSMQHFLSLINTCYIDLPGNAKASFANYNSPGDLS